MPKHTPDPGNAGVGRGKKLSVLRIPTLVSRWFNKFYLFTF